MLKMKRFLISAAMMAMMSTVPVQSVMAQKLTPENIDEIVSALTLDEKVHMIVGCGNGWSNPDVKFPGIAGWTYEVPRLGITEAHLADGPHGVNMNQTRDYDSFDYSCTTMPTSTAMAATWDVDVLKEVGSIIGYELKERGLDVILGPAINLQRNMLGGRIQEYMSEDPLLTGKMAAAYIKGVQQLGVGTSLKHFAANGAETRRKGSNSVVSPRALRELYLKNFEIAVKEAQPWTVMSSYNYINGIHTSENAELINDLLRKEWGFKGMVITDWDGGYYPLQEVRATGDILEPGSESQRQEIKKALEDGTLDMKLVDESVKRILEFTVKTPTYQNYKYSNDIKREQHQKQIRSIAAQSMVLLKNSQDVLPITALQAPHVALYGCTSYDFISGNMGVGGTNGGAHTISLVEGMRKAGFTVDLNLLRQYTTYIAAEKERIAAEAMKANPIMVRINRPARPVELIPQNELKPKEVDPRMAEMQANFNIDLAAMLGGGGTPETTLPEQVEKNDFAVITLGRTTGEGADRNYKEFEATPEELQLIETVSNAYHKAGKKVVVLLNVCGPMETQSWAGMVDAVLLVWEPGERSGESVADVLTGVETPSGRLPQTWALHYGDQPADNNFPSDYHTDNIMEFLGKGKMVDNPQVGVDIIPYEEGIYMGYRYFNTAKKEVDYPFGFGLSYTTFDYSNATLVPTADGFQVSVTVKNTGKRSGREVVQLYVTAPAGGLEKPARELKAFAKTRNLKPGEEQTLTMTVSNYDLASYNEKAVAWQSAKGNYSIQLGKNVEEIHTVLSYRLAKPQSWKTANLLKLQQPLNEISLKR